MGVTRVGKGGGSIPVESLWGRHNDCEGHWMTTRGAEKSQQCQKYFFNTVYFLPRDLRCEHGGIPNLLLAPGAK